MNTTSVLTIQYSNKTIPFSKKGKKTGKTEIIHQIFADAVKYALGDIFWKNILTNASKGIFPKLYKYYNNILIFKQRSGKNLYKEICQDDAQLCFDNVKSFMMFNGMFSMRDTIERKSDMSEETEENTEELKWKSIKSKKLKRLLLSKYVIYLTSRYNLCQKEKVNLDILLSTANATGLINKNNVIMDNNKIIDILILCYDSTNRNFFIDPSAKLEKITKAQLIKINEKNTSSTNSTIANQWDKFTKYLTEKENDRLFVL
jgi:hypothetical protein